MTLNLPCFVDIRGLPVCAEQLLLSRPCSGASARRLSAGSVPASDAATDSSEPLSPFRTNSLNVVLSIVEGCTDAEGVKQGMPLTLRSSSAQPPRAEADPSPSHLSLSCEVNQEFSSVNGAGCSGPPCGVKAVCGKRANMEDAHTVRTNFFDLPVSPSCSAEHFCNRLPSRIAVQLGTTTTHPSPLGSVPVSPLAAPSTATSDQDPFSASTLVTGDSSSSGSSELGCDTLHFFGVYGRFGVGSGNS